MSRRTHDVSSAASSYSIDLRQAINRFLPHSGLNLLSGNSKLRWVPRMLVVTALLMTWDAAETLTDRFDNARRAVAAMWPSRRRPGQALGGFMKALVTHSPRLLAKLLPELRRQVRRV